METSCRTRADEVRKAAGVVCAALIILMTCCRKDTVTSPRAQDLAGTWQATKAEYISADDPSVIYDVVAQGGTVTLMLTSADFTLAVAGPGATPQVTTGTWTSTSDLMTLNPSGASFKWQFEMNLSGDNLSLRGAHVEFDFDGDGTNDPALLNLTLLRQ
jgi:hypothetical protein